MLFGTNLRVIGSDMNQSLPQGEQQYGRHARPKHEEPTSKGRGEDEGQQSVRETGKIESTATSRPTEAC